MIIKLSMYIGLRDVHPAMEVNFSILEGIKTDRCLQFHNFGREKGKERKIKKKRKDKSH